MTNWLDPAEVRAAMHTEIDQRGMVRERTAALAVLEAIAGLPEPDAMCDVEGCPFIVTAPHAQPDTWVVGSHAYQEPLLHRLWSIARIVCGKEPCQTCGRPGCEGTHMVPDPRIIRKEEGREG